jgi:hypothetical protein
LFFLLSLPWPSSQCLCLCFSLWELFVEGDLCVDVTCTGDFCPFAALGPVCSRTSIPPAASATALTIATRRNNQVRTRDVSAMSGSNPPCGFTHFLNVTLPRTATHDNAP